MCYFKDLPDIIKKSDGNKYEKERGITTADVSLISRLHDIACFSALKSDGTSTLLVAHRVNKTKEDSWRYYAPTDTQVRFLKTNLPEIYDDINEKNSTLR